MKFNAQSKSIVKNAVAPTVKTETAEIQAAMLELSQEALAMIGGGAAMRAIGESRLPPWPPKSIWK
jgi:hypothetical protein